MSTKRNSKYKKPTWIYNSHPCEEETWPVISGLNLDVMGYVWCFLLDSSILGKTSCISKDYHDYARKMYSGTINLSAFKESHKRDNNLVVEILEPFVRATGLSARGADWFTDVDMRTLGTAEVMPSLSRIDVSNCPHVSSIGVNALIKNLGPRLHSFTQANPGYSTRKYLKVTDATIKKLADAPGLQELSLTLGSKVKDFGVKNFAAHRTLQKLSVNMLGFSDLELPLVLPELRELRIEAGSWSGFQWPLEYPTQYLSRSTRWQNLHYPKLELLVIDHGKGIFGSVDDNHPGPMLTSAFVIGLSREKFPNAEIRIVHAGTGSFSSTPMPLSFRAGIPLNTDEVFDEEYDQGDM